MRHLLALALLLLLVGCSSAPTVSALLPPDAGRVSTLLVQQAEQEHALRLWQLSQQSRREEQYTAFLGRLWQVLFVVSLIGSWTGSLLTLWYVRLWMVQVQRYMEATADKRQAEANALRIRETASGTVYLPAHGRPYLLGPARTGPPLALTAPAPAAGEEDRRDFTARQMWGQSLLALAWQAERVREMSGDRHTGWSERELTRNHVVTGPAWEALTGHLVQQQVLVRMRGGETTYAPGWDYGRLLATVQQGDLPLPATPAPRVNQVTVPPPHRTAPHRTASVAEEGASRHV